MKCDISEERLALYVGGELNAAEADALHEHLQVCNTCAAVSEALREFQGTVKALRADSVSPIAMSRLHREIMNQVVEQKRSPEWWRQLERTLFLGVRWKYALAGIAGVIAIGSLAILSQQEPQPVGSVATERTQTAGLLVPDEFRSTTAPAEPPPSPIVRKKPMAARRPQPATPEELPRQIMVKLFTDDPHIVIYWSIDGNGETQ